MYSQVERNMFVIGVCLAVTYFGLVLGLNPKYLFTINDACYQHSNDVISDVYDTMSLTKCLIVCAKDDCRSVLFDGNTQRCITYTSRVSITTPGCGWNYAEIDTIRSHVTCEVAGYSFDASKGSCVTDCTTYGTTFGIYPDHAISYFNDASVYVSTKQLCIDACIAVTRFVCKSAEFNAYSRLCTLSKETALTQASSYISRKNSDIDYFHRNCG